MSDSPTPAASSRQGRHGDAGSTLILVLLLVVVAGLVVLPLMSYTTSVLRLNTAVSENTKEIEAAKSGLRVAMTDPGFAFTECDDGGTLQALTINGVSVSTTCEELDEYGPLDAIGYQVPLGAVAMQLGAELPSVANGGALNETLQSDPVPPYPATEDWWAPHIPAPPNEPWDAVDDHVWIPELPRRPSTPRASTPFDMPASYNTASGVECKAFFPGHYDQPLVLDQDAYYYFASGVYYFEQPITIGGNADVVVGYGLEDFETRPATAQSTCADDLQVSMLTPPTIKAIDGGGATWVLGADARLIVDDSAGSPSIRFNQRYAEEDRGGRISIMTVNGVVNGFDIAPDPHIVPMVNHVPASRELETIDPETDTSVAHDIDVNVYAPSSTTYTDAARVPPNAPTLTATGERYEDASLASHGAIRLVWDIAVGNDHGGALLDSSEVLVGGVAACDLPGDIVLLPGAGAAGQDQLTCYIGDLDEGQTYNVSVAMKNGIGTGPPATATVTTPTTGPRDHRPGPVHDVALIDTDTAGAARVSWTAPTDDGGAPINRYVATIEHLFSAAQPDKPPELHAGGYIEVIGRDPVTTHVPATDPNGDALTVTVVSAPTDWTVTPTGGTELLVTPPLIGAPTDFTEHQYLQVAYTVSDGVSAPVAGSLTIAWIHQPTLQTPAAFDFRMGPDAGAVITTRVPAVDPNGDALTVALDTSSLGPEWSATAAGDEVTIGTTLTDGSTTLVPYLVTDPTGHIGTATIEVTAPTVTVDAVGSCTADAEPWFPTRLTCDVSGLADLTDPADIGYRARVEAINTAGASDPAYSPGPLPLAFEGVGLPAPSAPIRVVTPWQPEPIIDIRAGSAGATRVYVAGYVSTPMGRIRIDNPSGDGDDMIEMIGGVLAGTFDVVDDLDTESVVGFRNDIVLQRRIRIVSTAGSSRSTAVVQINEDGAGYAINSWVIS